MKVDILDYTIREVLFIKYKNGKQKLVAYLLKFLNKMERNYKIHDKKMLAVIRKLDCQRVQSSSLRFGQTIRI